MSALNLEAGDGRRKMIARGMRGGENEHLDVRSFQPCSSLVGLEAYFVVPTDAIKRTISGSSRSAVKGGRAARREGRKGGKER